MMSPGSDDESVVEAVIDFLVGMWLFFFEMASLLRRFSMSVDGDLRFHAAIASNRITLLAKNLEDGLSYLGADFMKILDYESFKRQCGEYAAGILDRLVNVLSALRGRLKTPEVLDVKTELREFEDAVSVAISAFSRMLEMISERRGDRRAELLAFLLDDLVSDLKLIGVRLQQAKSQLRIL